MREVVDICFADARSVTLWLWGTPTFIRLSLMGKLE